MAAFSQIMKKYARTAQDSVLTAELTLEILSDGVGDEERATEDTMWGGLRGKEGGDGNAQARTALRR